MPPWRAKKFQDIFVVLSFTFLTVYENVIAIKWLTDPRDAVSQAHSVVHS